MHYKNSVEVAKHFPWFVKLKQRVPWDDSDASALQEVASDTATNPSLPVGCIGTEFFTFTLNLCIPMHSYWLTLDRFCGLVVTVPGYRSRGSVFNFRRYQIFWVVVGLERGPLSLLSTIEELLGRNSSGSGLENREYGRGDPLPWPSNTLYPQKVGGRSVGIVRLRTKATEYWLKLTKVMAP
jgi:hypothetical protein